MLFRSLCERWYSDGLKVDWSKSCETLEIETRNYREFKERYQWYGQGDYRFVTKWWQLDRSASLRHLFHPLKNYMLKYPLKLISSGNFSGAAFSILCGANRYAGFIQEFGKLKKGDSK